MKTKQLKTELESTEDYSKENSSQNKILEHSAFPERNKIFFYFLRNKTNRKQDLNSLKLIWNGLYTNNL